MDGISLAPLYRPRPEYPDVSPEDRAAAERELARQLEALKVGDTLRMGVFHPDYWPDYAYELEATKRADGQLVAKVVR